MHAEIGGPGREKKAPVHEGTGAIGTDEAGTQAVAGAMRSSIESLSTPTSANSHEDR